MTIRKRAEEALALYCDQNNIVLSSDEYEEMLFDIYSKYMDEYLANPPKSEILDDVKKLALEWLSHRNTEVYGKQLMFVLGETATLWKLFEEEENE